MYSKEEKLKRIDEIKTIMSSNGCFYVTNLGDITVKDDMTLRRTCMTKGVHVKVVKNSLLSIAMKDIGIIPEPDTFKKINDECLRGISTMFFIDKEYGTPGRIINEFKKKTSNKVSLKFALADGVLYFGEDGLKKLSSMKTLDETLSDISSVIQSSINNLIGCLSFSPDKLAGALKTLLEKNK